MRIYDRVRRGDRSRDDLGPVNLKSPPAGRCRRSGLFKRVCSLTLWTRMNSNISRTISSKCRALVYTSLDGEHAVAQAVLVQSAPPAGAPLL